MNPELNESLARFSERYTSGQIPWDDTLPPPEVQALVATAVPGRALDLGCGYGRTAIYLAQRGWQVDGVDFVPQAIEGAQLRAAAADVANNTQFHVGSVADLDFLPGPYDLAVDVGCMHSLSEPMLQAYHDELRRLLQPGALFLLFAHLRDETADTEPYRWVNEAFLRELFADSVLEKCVLGVTTVNENQWRSGWFWYRR